MFGALSLQTLTHNIIQWPMIMSCMPALHSCLNGWRLTCIIEQCHIYIYITPSGCTYRQWLNGTFSVTCTRNESFEQGYWASNNSLFRNKLFCRSTPHVTINQILICKGAHADSLGADPLWDTEYCVYYYFELRRSLGSLIADPLWELKCCVLQKFLIADEVWAHSLQTLWELEYCVLQWLLS